MRNKLLIVALAVVAAVGLLGCAAQQETNRMNMLQSNLYDVQVSRSPQMFFSDLTKGLEVHVVTTQPVGVNTSNAYHLSNRSFFEAPTVRYVNSMGFEEKSSKSSYHLYITINKADIINFSNASVELDVCLKSPQGLEEFSQKHISTNANGYAFVKKSRMYVFQFALDEAYTQALEQINWNRIASFLRTEQLPKDEPQKQVQGLGDTALEHTIIRWDVQSRPQGADIFWRVVSKTPDVKSTNNKYFQTTPYEATKALDIRGLTYQTSGNVRIILRCEKEGYMPQEKEYDVRMVLDQEEISAFFRLVKEE